MDKIVDKKPVESFAGRRIRRIRCGRGSIALKCVRGFTLIELMIVVVIVGVLMAIAYPSYTKQMQKTRRASAQTDLLELAQFMERVYTENKSYLIGTAEPSLPFTQSPKDSTAEYYDLTIKDTITDTFYELLATPKGPQAGTGNVTLDSTGIKCWYKDGGSTCVSWN